MKQASSYPAEIKIDFVDIPVSIMSFLSQRGHHLRIPKKGEEGIPTTYSSIMGRGAQQVPSQYATDENLIASVEEYPFTNEGTENTKRADIAATHAIKFIFGPGRWGVLQKSYMINTSTTPIKIKASINGKPTKEVIYVKRPDTNRMVGRSFYDVTGGVPKTRWCFNRGVFVEEGIHGNPLSALDERLYLHDPRYKEGLVRAAVQADFLGLARDVGLTRNRIVDSDLRTILFDFNLLFGPRKPSEKNYLLELYMDNPHFFGQKEMDVYIDEQRQIVKRVEDHHKEFFKLARVFGQLVDHTYKPLDQRVQESYGARTLVEYLEKRLGEYRFA